MHLISNLIIPTTDRASYFQFSYLWFCANSVMVKLLDILRNYIHLAQTLEFGLL